jgi:hypothetical protein
MFSGLSDFLGVRRVKIRPQLISAIQCSKAVEEVVGKAG